MSHNTFSASDIFLSSEPSSYNAGQFLRSLGFRDAPGADRNLQAMAEEYAVREALGRIADPLMRALSRAPDPDAGPVGLERYLHGRTAKVNFLNYLAEDPEALELLVQLMGTSPFLSEILIRNPEYFHWLRQDCDRGLDETAPSGLEIDSALRHLEESEAQLDALKRFKRRQLLRIAARDILGKDSLESSAAQLSRLADAMVQRCLHIVLKPHALPAGRRRGSCGVIALGKLGGVELNYSSDIDLIYVYHLYRARASAPAEEAFFQSLFRSLTRALTEHTAESYLYRVDLRLRPMGKSGAITYSLGQYRQYYESWGETFERFALIKARPVAGEERLGSRFLQMARPFVYRKYLDEAALEEIARIKARAGAESRKRGDSDRDIKIGRGGIREIELFTQVLQLLYGGQQPQLRESNTLRALEKLLRARLISEPVCSDLTQAYIFLRTVEHRLQIVQERQLHLLPADPTEREICARRLGFRSSADLEGALSAHRSRVHEIYRSLLHDRTGRRSPARDFFRILSGDVPQEEARQKLSRYGFRDAAAALSAVESLDRAPSLIHSHSKARNLLANLLPALLLEAAACAEPERTLSRLDQLACRSGAAAALFRSLLEESELRRRLLLVLDSGELLAQRLIRSPELLDSLAAAPPGETPDPGREARMESSFTAVLDRMQTLGEPERLIRLRHFKSAEEFRILLAWLLGAPLAQLQQDLSRLAEHCLRRVADWHDPSGPRISDAQRGGPPASGRSLRFNKRDGRRASQSSEWAIFALGKLGGEELSVHSDLDLVFFYRGDPSDSETFLRHQSFVQKILGFLERPAAEGAAYRIDTRLRPEGTKGALALPLATFQRYLQERAEKWERLAWTRSRFLAGSARLAAEVSRAAAAFVYGPWNPSLPDYAAGIRQRMETELAGEATSERLDFKTGRGALADIDFLLQLIQIREGEHRVPFRVAGTRRLLFALGEESDRGRATTPFLRRTEIAELCQAYGFLCRLEILARMEADANISSIPANAEALRPLGKRMGMSRPEGSRLLAEYRKTTGRVRRIYGKVLQRLRR